MPEKDPRTDQHPHDSPDVQKFPSKPGQSTPYPAPGGAGTGTKDDPGQPDQRDRRPAPPPSTPKP